VRLSLLTRGRMPVTPFLDHQWYDSPNIHLCTLRDFVMLCDEVGVRIERSVTLDRHGRPFTLDPRGSLANLLAEQGVFVLSQGGM
jgi:methionine biosynthesis protein MetW